MGLKKHIPGTIAVGGAVLFLKEAIPRYILKEMPKNPVEVALWGATHILTFGPPAYALLKICTYEKGHE